MASPPKKPHSYSPQPQNEIPSLLLQLERRESYTTFNIPSNPKRFAELNIENKIENDPFTINNDSLFGNNQTGMNQTNNYSLNGFFDYRNNGNIANETQISQTLLSQLPVTFLY